jgi:IS30 family transposase
LERLEVLERVSRGETQPQVARALGTTDRTVRRVVAAAGGTPSRRSRSRPRSPFRLSLSEREEIRAGIAAGDSFRLIARRIGRAPSTVSREVGGQSARWAYRATSSEDRAALAARRPKPAKLAVNARLRRRVRQMLLERFSPQQISARLRLDYPDDPEMRIAAETIYQSLYVQSRGKGPGRGQIKDMVSISERPAEVADRAVPGHWEGDLIVGKQGRSFIGTLVERQTRFVLLSYLGNDSTTQNVCSAIADQITRLPEQLRRSLTWDQGKEMAAHLQFSVATGAQVYFCDPHSPWQRGSNENTNGLLRQYFPKGTDLAVHGQIELDQVAAQLNGRPRQTLEWQTPAEKMAQLLLR